MSICSTFKLIGALGAGDHVHLIIGKVIGGRVIKELQQKKATRNIKTAFNQAVLKHMRVDHKDYKPFEENRGRRLENWKYQNSEMNKNIEKLQLLNSLKIQTEDWLKLDSKIDIYDKIKKSRVIDKTIIKLKDLKLSDDEHNFVERVIKLKNKRMKNI